MGLAVTASDGEADFTDVWGNAVILAYAPQKPGGMEEPSFGYTYTMKQHPLVEQPYYDANKRSTIYGVTYERRPVLTGQCAGFLIKDPA